jgi:DNA-binding MarR family transcriptional regulator
VKNDRVQVNGSPLLALQRATHAVTHRLSAALVDLDLSASEINALANLADGRTQTISQLASAIGTRPTTLTSLLDRLERRGYVTRLRHASDRRSVLLELTETGRAASKLITKTVRELESSLLAGFSSTDVRRFRAVLYALSEEQ